MTKLNHDTVDYIAHRLLENRYDPYGRELVALIGTGRESNNLAAVGDWVVAQSSIHIPPMKQLLSELRDVFDDCLSELQADIRNRVGNGLSVATRAPRKSLTDAECRCVADAIAYVVAGPVHRSRVNIAAGLSLGQSISCRQGLYQWVRAQEDRYVTYPAELTMVLAQRLLRSLTLLEDVYG